MGGQDRLRLTEQRRPISVTTASSTCPGLLYSAGRLFPSPATNRWFSAGNDFIVTPLSAPTCAFHSAKSFMVTW